MYLTIFVVLILLFCGVCVAFIFIWVPFVFSYSSISLLLIWQFSPPHYASECLSVSLLLPVSAVKALSCRMWHKLRWANPNLNCAGCCCHYFVLETPAPCHSKTCISHLERDISEECVVSSLYGWKLVS